MDTDKRNKDKHRILAAIIVFGSVWGMLECTIGGATLGMGVVYFPMGAVMAGVFGVGFMGLSRRLFAQKGMALGIALVAGVLRFFAPVGSCLICSSIAIMAEGVIFEIIMGRPAFSFHTTHMKDPRTLTYLGVIVGYTIYVSGYIITQLLTPLVAGDGGQIADVAGILPLIFGRGFFAGLLGGVTLPVATFLPHLNIDVARVRKDVYYSVSTATAGISWAVVLVIYFSGIF